MNYPLKSKRSTSSLQKHFLPVSAAATFFLSLFLFAHPFFSDIFKNAFRPWWTAEAAVFEKANFLSAFLTPRMILEEENRLLKEEILGLKLNRMTNDVLRFENARLRELENRAPSVTGMLVAVLSRPPYTPFDTLIVDAGEKEGVKKDESAVFLGTYLGRVIGIDSHTSHVLLASSPGENIQVFVARTGESIRMEGRGSGNFVALLPKTFDIVKGDVLETFSLDNLIVAEVGHIDTDPASSFQAVYLKSPVSINSLQRVMLYPSLNR